MKTGKQLIAEEREKVLKTISKEDDLIANQWEQLSGGARILSEDYKQDSTKRWDLEFFSRPHGWDTKQWQKMCAKPYLERLIIAGQLYLAEADRCKAMADKIAKQLDFDRLTNR